MNIKAILLTVAMLLNVAACQATNKAAEPAPERNITVSQVDKATIALSKYLDKQSRHVVINSFSYMSSDALYDLPLESYFDLTRQDVDPQARKVMQMMNVIKKKITHGDLDQLEVQKHIDGVYDNMTLAIAHVDAAYSYMQTAQSKKSVNERLDALNSVNEHIEIFSNAINAAAEHHLVLNDLAFAE